jgi:ligand-binding sensor domain-containing protein
MLKRFLLCVFVSFHFVDGYTQNGNILFDHLDHVQTLKYLSVTCIAQDNQGYMWFGSADGLLRYDGYQVKLYKHDSNDSTSLSDNNIRDLAADDEGNLWIATQGGGLNRLILEEERFVHYVNDPKDKNSISGNAVWSLMIDTNSNIWAGTWSNGLVKFDPKTEIFQRHKANTKDPVLAIYEDPQGIIWYGSKGLNKYNPKTKQSQNFNSNSNQENTISSNSIRSIIGDNRGGLWIATENGGLNYLNKNSGEFSHYLHSKKSKNTLASNAVYDLVLNKEDLWIATQAGLNKLNITTKEFHTYVYDPADRYSLSNNQTRVIFNDNQGSIWVGNEGSSINKVLNRKEFITYNYRADKDNGLSNNLIRALYEDDKGIIWVGTQGGGLNKIDRKRNSIQIYNTDVNSAIRLSSNDLSAIYKDKDGIYWFGFWGGGIDKYDPKTKRTKKYVHTGENSVSDNRIQVFHEDRFGVFWVGTENGLSTFNKKSENWERFGKGSARLNGNTIQGKAFIEGNDGTLWVGTWNGLNKISPKRSKVNHYTSNPDDPTSINNDHVISLYLDKRAKKVYVGTFGGGLNVLDIETGKFDSYTESEGLSNNTIFGILEDDNNNLWLSTNKGLSRFNKSTKQFRNYDASEGLQSNEFYWGSAHKNMDGSLMFGGVGGMNLFYPNQIKDNTMIPPVVLSDFQIFNKPVSIGVDSVLEKSIGYTKGISLRHQQSVLSFSFSALNFQSPEKNQYAYMLEGFEDNWNYVGNKHLATYTNLDPGDYVLRIKGSNNDNVWNEEGKVLNITVLPPWWNSWWFRSFAFILIVGFSLWISNMRRVQRKEAKRILEEKVTEATNEVIAQNATLQMEQDNLQAAIQDTNFVIKEAVESGNFKARINLDDKSGEWYALGDSINQMFESVLTPFNFLNNVMGKLAEGDLTARYTEKAQGDILTLANNLNAAISNLSELLKDINTQTQHIGGASQEMMLTGEEMSISTSEISVAISEMSSGAGNQQAQVDESSSLLEGVLSFSEEMGNQAKTINEVANMGVNKGENGK